MSHEITERLVISLPDVEQRFISIEASARLLLDMDALQLVPHFLGSAFEVLDMHFLTVIYGKPDLSTGFSSLPFPGSQLLCLICSGFGRVDWFGLRSGAINILPKFFGAQVGFHIVSPLAPV